MKISILVMGTLCLMASSFFSVAMAEVAGITTGAQLQTLAESKTQNISTEDLNKMLNEELDMVLIDIRTADEIKSMGGTIKAE